MIPIFILNSVLSLNALAHIIAAGDCHKLNRNLEDILPKDCGLVRRVSFADYDGYTCTRDGERPTHNKSSQRFIRNGHEAHEGEFPSFARLDVRLIDGSQMLCSGTLISDRLVLTAAHCVTSAQQPIEIKVSLGLTNKRNARHVTTSERACWPPDYDASNFSKDIALVVLADEPQLDEFIWPACLDFKWPYKYVAGCLTVGTGAKFAADDKRDVVAAIQVEDCPLSASWGEDKCFQTRGAVCPGDSGGPTYCINKCGGAPRQVVVGATRYTESCPSAGSTRFRVSWFPNMESILRDILDECSRPPER